ncbi:hypothetical protein BV22DRAFT_1030130 [Leucogyrophana mollusca]|uniref:Uncharacterized protein n=1 Tax=Leucogyrophana mollusca TaxID=85980 RepID=A0ACB8BSK8_9AGAM|nr:hypothetical protein BV22DRAFT_1030130 [Leucogyrophana mollusca]
MSSDHGPTNTDHDHNTRPGSRPSTFENSSVSQWTLNELASTARDIMSEYVSAVRCIPPQVIVSCRGERHAYSRNFLKTTGYNGAANKFLSRFARAEDYSETSFLGIRYMASPNVHVFATFYPRCHHAPDAEILHPINRDPNTESPVSVGRDGWAGLIDNVAYLEVVLARRE